MTNDNVRYSCAARVPPQLCARSHCTRSRWASSGERRAVPMRGSCPACRLRCARCARHLASGHRLCAHRLCTIAPGSRTSRRYLARNRRRRARSSTRAQLLTCAMQTCRPAPSAPLSARHSKSAATELPRPRAAYGAQRDGPRDERCDAGRRVARWRARCADGRATTACVKADKGVVLAAVAQDDGALQFASAALKADTEVVLS